VSSSRPARYEIRVDEALDGRWSEWFEGMHITTKGGETIISGPLPDESALHGVLAKVRDLGLHLIAVCRLGPGEEEAGMIDRDGPILPGERVLLRPGRGGDVQTLVRIRTEPEVARWWGELGANDIRDEFVDVSGGFVIEVAGQVVGAIQYAEENEPMYRHAGIDLFITSARHGHGLGSEAIRVLARYLFEERGHHRLTIDPAADNHLAIRAYERVGFRAVGVMRQYERAPDGTWRDGLLMDLLKEDFRNRPTKSWADPMGEA
jgi:aminoglycoside 6'-N-acetyltransferase